MNSIVSRGLLLLLLAVVQLARGQPAHASAGDEPAIQVLASIRPLALIAQDLLGPMAQVDTLLRGTASPHSHALKVSDVRKLGDADLVIWMGPDLERFLEKPVSGFPAERVLALGKSSRRPHGEQHGDDLHQWLDPALAQEMSRQIARRLQQLFPERASAIRQRLHRQLKDYETLIGELEQTLAPVRSVGFVVAHRGYDHFVAAFDLNQVGWISASPEQPPGVRRLYQLRKKLQALPPEDRAQCLFVELAHGSDSDRTLARQLGVRRQELDLLGRSADSYSGLMHNLATAVRECLAE